MPRNHFEIVGQRTMRPAFSIDLAEVFRTAATLMV
jgi:hypothetical protein